MAEISESVNDAVKDAADQEAAAAHAVAEAAKAEAAESIAAGGAAATAAAQGAAALATTHAAEIIKQNEETTQWLKSNAEQTGSSLNKLVESHNQLVQAIPEIVAKSQAETLTAIQSLLTPKQLTPPPTPTADSQTASEEEDARQEVEKKKKPKRGPQHKENWT